MSPKLHAQLLCALQHQGTVSPDDGGIDDGGGGLDIADFLSDVLEFQGGG